MFGWLKRRGKTTAEGEAQTAASAPPPMPVAARAPAAAPAPLPKAAAAAQPCTKSLAPAKSSAPRAPLPARPGPKDIVVPVGYREPKPKVGMPALELGPKTRKASIVTLVHADGRFVVARLADTGAARSYARQPDGTYRLAGHAIRKPPRLVLGLK